MHCEYKNFPYWKRKKIHNTLLKKKHQIQTEIFSFKFLQSSVIICITFGKSCTCFVPAIKMEIITYIIGQFSVLLRKIHVIILLTIQELVSITVCSCAPCYDTLALHVYFLVLCALIFFLKQNNCIASIKTGSQLCSCEF